MLQAVGTEEHDSAFQQPREKLVFQKSFIYFFYRPNEMTLTLAHKGESDHKLQSSSKSKF
jgi:hypothetical protein